MAEAFTFELVSPERLLLSISVTEVVVPGSDGYMTVMANQAATMSTLQPGMIEAKGDDGNTQAFFVAGGLADISGNGLTILAEFAVPKSEMTKDIYAERKRLAQEAYDSAMAGDDEQSKANARSYLDQLNHMEQTIIPA
jgi:F-type H+-transporting ATPase subunit epsilon